MDNSVVQFYQDQISSLKASLAKEEQAVLDLKNQLAVEHASNIKINAQVVSLSSAKIQVENELCTLRSEVGDLKSQVVQKEHEVAAARKTSSHSVTLLEAQNCDLKATAETLRAEKTALFSKLAEVELGLKNTKSSLGLEEIKSSGLAASLKQLSEVNQSMSVELKSLRDNEVQLSILAKNQDQEIKRLHRCIASLEKSLKEREMIEQNLAQVESQRLLSVQQALCQEQRKSAGLQGELAIEQIKSIEKDGALKGSRQELEQLRVALSEKIEQGALAKTEIIKSEQQLMACQVKLEKVEASLRSVSSVAIAHGVDLGADEASIQALLEEGEIRGQGYKARQDRSSSGFHSEAVKALKTKEQTLQMEVNTLKSSNEALKKKSEASQSTISSLQERLVARQSELSVARSQFSLLEGAIAAKQDQCLVQEIQEEINKAVADPHEYEKLIKKEADLIKEHDTLRGVISYLKQEVQGLSAENKELKKVKEAQVGKPAPADASVAFDVAAFEASLSAKVREIADLKMQLANSKKSAGSASSSFGSNLENTVASLKKELSSAGIELKKKQSELSTITSKQQIAEQSLLSAKQLAQAEKERSTKLQKQASDLMEKVAQLDSNLLTARVYHQQEITALKTQLSTKTAVEEDKPKAEVPLPSQPSSTNVTQKIIVQNSEIQIRQMRLQMMKANTDKREAEAKLAFFQDEDAEMVDSSNKEDPALLKLKEEHSSELKKKEEVIQKLKELFAEMEKKKEEMEVKNEDLIKQAISKNQSAFENLKAKLASTQKSKQEAEEKVQALSAELSSFKDASQPGDLKHMTDKQRADYLETQAASLKEEVVQLKLENEALVLELRALKETTAMQLKMLQEEIDRANELQKQDGESAKAWLEKDLTKLQNENFVNVNKITALTKKLASLEATCSGLTSEVQHLKEKAKIDAVADQTAVKETKELNETIKMWQLKFSNCFTELSQVKVAFKETQSKSATDIALKQKDAAREVAALKDQLVRAQSQFDTLLEHTNKTEDLKASSNMQVVFRNFFVALKRSRTLIEMIILSLEGKGFEEAKEKEEAEKIEVGTKRQKPSEE